MDLNQKKITHLIIDLDDTLLTPNKQISIENLKAINYMENNGIRVIFASARPPRTIRKFLSSIRLSMPIIAYNGALIYDLDKDDIFRNVTIALEDSIGIYELLIATYPDINISIESRGKWYIRYYREEIKPIVMKHKLVPPEETRVTSEILSNLEVTKFFFKMDGLLDIENFITKLKDSYPNVRILMENGNCEIFHGDVDKLTGVKLLTEIYSFDLDNVVAVGDGINDMELIKGCGIGVAVSNASAEVKAVADFIVDNCNYNAIDQLRKLLFNHQI